MELSVAIINTKKFRKVKFAKLICVLIFSEVKKNDSNDTLDDEVQKAVLYTQRYFFSEGDGCYLYNTPHDKVCNKHYLKTLFGIDRAKNEFYS